MVREVGALRGRKRTPAVAAFSFSVQGFVRDREITSRLFRTATPCLAEQTSSVLSQIRICVHLWSFVVLLMVSFD